MSYLSLYAVTFCVFLTIDFFGLGLVVKPMFEKHVPELLLDRPKLGPALAFYAFYVFGLIWFVSAPALAGDKSYLWVLGHAALIAGIGFGTYEFTSLAVIKGWSWEIVVVDLVWGITMTCVAALAGVGATRWMM